MTLITSASGASAPPDGGLPAASERARRARLERRVRRGARVRRGVPSSRSAGRVGFAPKGRGPVRTSNLNFQAMVQDSRNDELTRRRGSGRGEGGRVGELADARREALAPGELGHTIYGYVDEGESDREDARMLVRTFFSAGVEPPRSCGIQFALKALAETLPTRQKPCGTTPACPQSARGGPAVDAQPLTSAEQHPVPPSSRRPHPPGQEGHPSRSARPNRDRALRATPTPSTSAAIPPTSGLGTGIHRMRRADDRADRGHLPPRRSLARVDPIELVGNHAFLLELAAGIEGTCRCGHGPLAEHPEDPSLQ